MLFAVAFFVLVSATEAKAVYIDYGYDHNNMEAWVSGFAYSEDKENPECTEIEILSEHGVINIEKEYVIYTVVGINSYAFWKSKYLEKVILPETIRVIEKGAFYACTALKDINLPSGMKAIEAEVFRECESLEEITIPETVESIGERAFQDCSKLKEIVLPNAVTDVEKYCFSGCTSLEKVVLPDKLDCLSWCMFEDCTSLKEVVLPKGLETIGMAAFYGCTSLEQLVIPEKVRAYSSGSFDDCTNLKVIYYPEGSAYYGDLTAHGVTEKTMQITYSVNEDGTVSLNILNIPQGMTDIQLPADIYGRKIVSITGPQGNDVSVSCVKHHTKTYTTKADGHEYTCLVCKKGVKEAHSYGNGSQPCVCGYVPFTISKQPVSLQSAYASSNSALSVTAKATFGTEKIAYQWYEGGKAIAGATAATYKISKSKPVGNYTYTCKLTSGSYSQVTKAATVTVKAPAKGKKYKDDKKMATYKVTKARADGKGTVEYVKPVNKKKSVVTIPATVKIGGVTYKVTSIAKNAFKGNKNIKRLTIEKNVEKIGAKAFYGCKKLKTITIKTTKLKAKKIGAAAFKNTHVKATVKVPKKKLKAYKTMLLKKGVSSKAKIRKM